VSPQATIEVYPFFAAPGRLPSTYLFAALREQEKGKEAMSQALQDGVQNQTSQHITHSAHDQ
jgi:hypothetical protein